MFRSQRVPNEGISFDQTLTKYANLWAKVEEYEVRWNNGVQCDPYTGHRFTVRRNEQLLPEERDVINWQGRLFRVERISPVDTDRVWITLICREDVNLKSPSISDTSKVSIVISPPAAQETGVPAPTKTYW